MGKLNGLYQTNAKLLKKAKPIKKVIVKRDNSNDSYKQVEKEVVEHYFSCTKLIDVFKVGVC